MKVEFEYSVPVIHYAKQTGSHNAFEELSQDDDWVKADMGLDSKNIKLVNIEFLEFDSSNINHAAAYFNVEVDGEENVLKSFLSNELGYDAEEVAEIFEWSSK